MWVVRVVRVVMVEGCKRCQGCQDCQGNLVPRTFSLAWVPTRPQAREKVLGTRLLSVKCESCEGCAWGGEGVLPIIAYTGRLRLKGVLFSGFRYKKMVGISQVDGM